MTAYLKNQVSPIGDITGVLTEPDGTMKYYKQGLLHRDDGPAVIEPYPDDGPNDASRHLYWYRAGLLHRDRGPAVIGCRSNGNFEWWINGQRHRADGPAVINLIESYEWGEGETYEWWLEGRRLRVQDGDGIIYHFSGEDVVFTELPDGRRLFTRDGDIRYEDEEGNDLGEPPGNFENYIGYLKFYSCSHELYRELEAALEGYRRNQYNR